MLYMEFPLKSEKSSRNQTSQTVYVSLLESPNCIIQYQILKEVTRGTKKKKKTFMEDVIERLLLCLYVCEKGSKPRNKINYTEQDLGMSLQENDLP